MGNKVFIDGHAGTIGLRIRELIAARRDLQVLEIAEERRKDPAARRDLLNSCDVAILCLPDEAAVEAVALIENPAVRVIDGSTAHRVAEDWAYGLPELSREQRQQVTQAKRVSNPGCYPTGIALLLRPLTDAGLVPTDFPLSVHALSGYSGGGKAMIEKWESPEMGLLSLPFEAPYALERKHKHVAEMMRYGRLAREPYFVPAVGPFRCGMRIEIPLHAAQLPQATSGRAIWEAYAARYVDERFVRLSPLPTGALDERTFDPTRCNGTNTVELHVVPHPSGHVLLVALLDNLGKGASGAAVQSLNLMLGFPEALGLSHLA
jgi:N-acetyl-gamma-glutamyl-phosphate reductase